MRWISYVTSAAAVGFCVVACGSSSDTPWQQLQSQLSFMDGAVANCGPGVECPVKPVDATSAAGSAALAPIATAIKGSPALAKFIKGAGTESAPSVSVVTTGGGKTGTIAIRTWSVGDVSAPTSASSIVRVTQPSGDSVIYTEHHVFSPGWVDDETISTVSASGDLQAVNTAHFDPTMINISANNGGATSESIAPGELNTLGGGLTADAGGPLVTSLWCRIPALGIVGWHYAGILAVGLSATGASTAICTFLGIGTAAIGGIAGGACHLVMLVIMAGATLPGTFTPAAQDVNYVSKDILGSTPWCDGYSDEATAGLSNLATAKQTTGQ